MRHSSGNQRTLRVALLPTLLAGLLAACGGGGITGQELTGKVMDGYIKGAVVCLDVNANGVCNSDEPQAETTTGGVYSLDVPTDAELGGTNLLVEVPVGAIDEDTPDTPIATAYKMRGVASAEAVVSPLTTVLAAHLDNGETEADALTAMGLTGVDLKADYVASGNTQVHNVAKLLARNFQAAGTQSAAQIRARVATIKASLQTAHATTTAMSEESLLALVPASSGTSTNLLTNGDFEGGASAWTASYGTPEVQEAGGNKYFFSNVQAAGNPWDVGITNVVSLTEGVRYKLTFTASTGEGQSRVLRAGIGLNQDPWTADTTDVNLTSTSQTFELTFTAPATNANSRVLFDMGHDVGVVVIDNVSLEVVEPVAATDLLTNGDFEGGASAWTASYGTPEVQEAGGNKYFFANVQAAGNPWDVGIANVVSLTEGVRYKLTFAASTGEGQSRVLRAGIGLNQDPWTADTTDVNLTSTSQTFELTFTAPATNANSRVLFDMGHDVGVVVIDNVSLVRVEGSSSSGESSGGSSSETAGSTLTLSTGFTSAVATIEGGLVTTSGGSNFDNWGANCVDNAAVCGTFSGGAAADSYAGFYYQTTSPADGLYSQMEIFAPGVTTPFSQATGDLAGLTITDQTKVNFTFNQNAEWFEGSNNKFAVILTLGKRYAIDGGCYIQLHGVKAPTAVAATAYSMNLLTDFRVAADCGTGIQPDAVAAALANNPVSSVKFAGAAGPAAFIGRNSLTSGGNLTTANNGVYPTTVVVKGGITFN